MRTMVMSVAVIVFAAGLSAQQTQTPSAAVPRLVRIANTFRPASGLAAAPVESITLSVYREEHGGTALWTETQNVAVDGEGRYSALLGSTLPDGVPADLFTAAEPRWLGVQFNRPGEGEQPRVLLVSVPYALKASDADTLGGRPASAYLLDPAAATPVSAAGTAPGAPAAAGVAPLTAAKSPKPRAITGNMNYLPYFTDNSNDLGNSVAYQSNGRIGLNTTSPLDFLHVQFTNTNGAFTGYAVQNLGNTSSSYSGMLFYDQNGALGQFQGFNNVTHEYRINNIASGGSINFMLGGASKFFVGAGGVGIGTTTPGNVLVVSGASAPATFVNTSGAFYDVVLQNGGDNSLTRLGTAKGGHFVIGPNGTEAMRVTSSGNVGIGTTTPAYPLDIAADLNFGGSVFYQGNPLLQISGGVSSGNMGLGITALAGNTSGTHNTALGFEALNVNTTGEKNTATGFIALASNTTGSNNIATGGSALNLNTTGAGNTADGFGALVSNTTGNNNIGIGYLAAAGVAAGNSNNIHIGTAGASGDSATIRIGGNTSLGDSATQTSFFAAGIRGVTTGNNDAIAVLIDSNGQLGTVSSSRRYKEDIQDMGDASRGLMQLRPVTFRYKKPFADGSKPIQYGLIAEEVAEVYPDLVARNSDGQIETVKYQVLTPMLLNEVQRQQAEIESQMEQIRLLQQQITELRSAMTSLARGNQTETERARSRAMY